MSAINIPAELNAGGTESLRLSLSPSTANRTGNLFVFRAAEGSQSIRLLERSTSVDNPHHITDTPRFLDLAHDAVLPLYAISQGRGREWVVELAYDRGKTPVAYPFPSRSEAFNFQKLLTGYTPVSHVENVYCAVASRGFPRRSKYAGSGEIQLWKAEERESLLQPISPVSSNSSQRGPASSIETPPQYGGSFSVHTNPINDRSVYVTRALRPPLLVAFLRDSEGNKYTMLKINVMDLDLEEFKDEGRLGIYLNGVGRRDFPVKQLSSDLRSWNLYNLLRQKAPTARSLTCTYMTVEFGTPERHKDMENLERDIFLLQNSHLAWAAGEPQVAQSPRQLDDESRSFCIPTPRSSITVSHAPQIPPLFFETSPERASRSDREKAELEAD